MPDRLWNKPKGRRMSRLKRTSNNRARVSMFLTKCVLSLTLVALMWVGAKVAPVKEFLQYVFVPGAAADSPWATWLDWQPRNEMVQPVWVALTGRQDNAQFDLPIDGEISSTFGWATSTNNEPTYNDGLLIAATPGTLVHAVLSGRVVDVDNALGSVTIDHGSEMLTVYRGLTDITVQAGGKVKQRDALGRLHLEGKLFFGLYQTGRPQDPLLRTREGIR